MLRVQLLEQGKLNQLLEQRRVDSAPRQLLGA
jgi:hypothetical protein